MDVSVIPPARDDLNHLRPEGELNLWPRRLGWVAEHLAPQTQLRLETDARHFLHQSRSTPSRNVLAKAEGA